MFRKIILSVVLSLSSLSMAVDLSQASNGQILDELSRRLAGGGGGTGSAVATYLCTSAGYLQLSLTGVVGSSQKTLFIGTTAECSNQANDLRANKSRVQGVTVAAACTTAGYLVEYPLRSDGVIGQVRSTFLGTYASCLSQARSINSQE